MGIPIKVNTIGTTRICICTFNHYVFCITFVYVNILVIANINSSRNLTGAVSLQVQVMTAQVDNHGILFRSVSFTIQCADKSAAGCIRLCPYHMNASVCFCFSRHINIFRSRDRTGLFIHCRGIQVLSLSIRILVGHVLNSPAGGLRCQPFRDLYLTGQVLFAVFIGGVEEFVGQLVQRAAHQILIRGLSGCGV